MTSKGTALRPQGHCAVPAAFTCHYVCFLRVFRVCVFRTWQWAPVRSVHMWLVMCEHTSLMWIWLVLSVAHMTGICVRRDSSRIPTWATWLVHMWLVMCHSCDSFICETWLIHMWDMTHSYVRHDSFICETWLIHMWDMTHSYVRHDSFICETWRIHMWDMTHSYMRHDSFIRETWLIQMCDMTHSEEQHDGFKVEVSTKERRWCNEWTNEQRV